MDVIDNELVATVGVVVRRVRLLEHLGEELILLRDPDVADLLLEFLVNHLLASVRSCQDATGPLILADLLALRTTRGQRFGDLDCSGYVHNLAVFPALVIKREPPRDGPRDPWLIDLEVLELRDLLDGAFQVEVLRQHGADVALVRPRFLM